MVGMIVAVIYNIYDNKRYIKIAAANHGFAPPESRLTPCMMAAVAIPIGLFWFAWSNGPSVHWMASIAAGAPFGFGMVLVFLSLMNYLIDAYTIFAASVLAASAVLRSLFAAAFPLFTSYMYRDLGVHWASSIPAFLAVACAPFPFLFYKYGPAIRRRCKYAAESDAFMRKLMEVATKQPEPEKETSPIAVVDELPSASTSVTPRSARDLGGNDHVSSHSRSSLERIRSKVSIKSQHQEAMDAEALYDANPYGIDRVNTRESFKN